MSKLRTPEQYAKHYERVKKYRASKKGASKTYEVNRRSQLKHRTHKQARSIIENELRRGRIIKPEGCSNCGGSKPRIEGHHPDYNKPKEVVWLCTPCHVQVHSQNAIIGIKQKA